MSRAYNALKMLLLLKNRGRMKREELARELEIDEKSIYRYKEDLLDAGIEIKSISGKYGGYEFVDNEYLTQLSLTTNEYNALLFAVEHLKQENFPYNYDLNILLEKINDVKKIKSTKTFESTYFIKNTAINYDTKIEKKYWLAINAAIITSNKMTIEYTNAQTHTTNRIIQPYEIFQYDGAMYLDAYCEDAQEFRHFKLSRIIEIAQRYEDFERDINYNLKDRMRKCIGIFKDGEINIKLRIDYPFATTVKEKVFVDNQRITEKKDDNRKYILFEAKVVGKTQIKSWIMGMGKNAIVVEPEFLKQELLEEYKKIIENYK